MFEWLTNALKTSATLPLKIRNLFGYTEVPAPSTTEDLLKQYEEEPWVYSPVWVTANTCARVPRRMRKKATEEYTYNHALLDLLNYPNENQSGFDFFEEAMSYYRLAGEVFWEVVPNKLKVPAELYNLRPDRVDVCVDEDGRGIDHYEFKVPGVSDPVIFKPEQIIHIKAFSPRDDWRGMSPQQPLINNLVQEGFATRWRKRFLKRFGTPEGALSTEQSTIPKPLQDRLQKQWQKGFDEGEGTPVFPKGLTWMEISQPPRPSGMFDLLKWLREEKLSTYGVPPVKVGLLEFAKYANYDLQSRAFFIDTITPLMEKFAAAINRRLLPLYEKSGDYVFEFDTLSITYADLGSLSEVLTRQFESGALSPNEYMALTGIGQKYDQGDEHYIGERRMRIGDVEAPEEVEPVGEVEDLGDTGEATDGGEGETTPVV